ncbi:MAG: S9 family peptidase, partial [Planctomycetes bacterium]|nr:S9 family peptidase [Planctomycetota bacterium]
SFLTPADYAGHVEHLAWRNDQDLCLVAAEGCASVMTIQDASDPARRTRVELPQELILGAFSLDRAGSRLAVLGQSADHPVEAFTLGGDQGLRRLTITNPALSQYRLARQEVRSFRARDGLEVGGVLIWPLDYESGTKYPLILVVHGGPEARDANGWQTSYSRPGQVAAARGFFVFHINYRGSTGRGVAYSQLDQGRMGREEFDDLVDGVESLVSTGLVSVRLVGIAGGSYGGYASAWAATTLTEHFAASVMFVGISEQISKVLTTDIPDESFHSHWNKRLWDDWQDFLEASPIYHLKNAKTPILIAHGKDDPRVPVAQSRELYQALKIRGGVPVRLVLYPGEGHGNRRRASQLDYGLRQMRWFEHFLLRGEKDLPPSDIEYQAANQ